MLSGIETSLYIHIPFCAGGKCDYCDFYSVPLEPGDSRPERFVDVLLQEGERLFEKFRPACVPTVYIGGGTPSVLGSGGIRKLLCGLSGLTSRFSPPPEEITVEANPESADEAFLSAAREAGATRLSLGVQTFHEPSRRAVHRVPAAGVGESLLSRRLALAAEYFPDSFSADIISGLPFQSEKVLLDDIAALLSYRPAHVSLYALTLEPGTPLALKAAAKDTPAGTLRHGRPAFPSGTFLPDRDEADRLWLCGRDALEKSGYGQYEVSNFCLHGRESRHNIRYWRMQNWLALGPSASATIIDDKTGKGFRYTIPREMVPGTFFTEDLTPLTLIKESFLMGFRYIEGPDEDLFRRRFRRGILELIPKTSAIWQERGFLRKDKSALTKEGLLFLDSFLLDAFQELDLSRSELDASFFLC